MKGIALSLLAACLVSAIAAAQAQDCSDITGKICSLTGFEPNPDINPAQARTSPNCSTDAMQTQKEAIQAAFDVAPMKVKNDLCKLTKIFVVTDHASWGRWENPANHGGASPGKTQIAINANDIGATFSKKQDDNVKAVAAKANGKHDDTLSGRIDANTLGLFYILAHEAGHVRWHRDLGIGDGIGCADDANFYSWQDISMAKGRPWAGFNKPTDDKHKRNVNKPADVANDSDLKSIYTGGFVTALAAISPEEDFVESYAIRALMDLPLRLTSLSG